MTTTAPSPLTAGPPAVGAEVTVLVPAYNAAPTLAAALGSVAAQTTQPGEVVVVDDGSTDDTAAIAARWSGVLPVRVLRLADNVGLSQCRAEGMKTVTTRFVALLDADDVWLPDHLECMVGLADDRTLVTAQMLRWIPGHGVASAVDPHWASLPPPERQLRELYRLNWIAIAMMYPVDAYRRVGGFRPGLRRSEDWDLTIRLLRAGLRVRRPVVTTVLYRTAPGSLSAGQANAASDVEILGYAVNEALDDEERGWAAASLRARSARLAVVEAYELARQGQTFAARRRAVPSLWRGDKRGIPQGIFLVTAPRRATVWRDARNADYGRML